MNYKLQSFAQNELILARSAKEREKINSSLSHLETIIKNKLEVNSIIRFGSFTRNTILPRKYDSKSDVDLMVVFDGNYSSGTYRKYILDVLSNAYPNSISQKDFPALKLELNHIKFDVIPAIIQNDYWSGNQYFIPDRNNTWMATVPNDINQELASNNQSSGGNIIRQVIRLCKHWNANAGYPMSSYLMEKEIINLWYWGNENTYDRFLKTLSSIAGNISGVSQAIDYIRKYEGDWLNEANKEKQLQWLQKLLPGLE